MLGWRKSVLIKYYGKMSDLRTQFKVLCCGWSKNYYFLNQKDILINSEIYGLICSKRFGFFYT